MLCAQWVRNGPFHLILLDVKQTQMSLPNIRNVLFDFKEPTFTKKGTLQVKNLESEVGSKMHEFVSVFTKLTLFK